ncbi:hypothetical protein EJ110_NYTH36710 [Nymphaea thermarum]|nr:hypothetical protein EJ110_NYTH36710 [Nymphaea thermarum]
MVKRLHQSDKAPAQTKHQPFRAGPDSPGSDPIGFVLKLRLGNLKETKRIFIEQNMWELVADGFPLDDDGGGGWAPVVAMALPVAAVTNKLEDFLNRLEEERLKIDAFKRELPLCMQLLNDVMEASRQQLAACQLNHSSRPVFEEFIPLKHPESSDRSLTAIETSPDKTTWMTTAQLWSQTNDGSKQKGSAAMESEHGLPATSKLGLDAKQRNGGAFLPFTKDKTGATQALRPLPELALAPTDKCADEPSRTESAAELAVPVSRIMSSENVHRSNDNGGGGSTGTDHKSGNEQAQTAGQTHRKPRRCWSPDLHRRFVNALQQLGGSQEIQTAHKEAKPHAAGSSGSASTSAGCPWWDMGSTGIHDCSPRSSTKHVQYYYGRSRGGTTVTTTTITLFSSFRHDTGSESGSWKGENAEKESRKELGRGLSLRKSRCLRSEKEDDQEGEESTGSDITLKF